MVSSDILMKTVSRYQNPKQHCLRYLTSHHVLQPTAAHASSDCGFVSSGQMRFRQNKLHAADCVIFALLTLNERVSGDSVQTVYFPCASPLSVSRHH